MLEPRPNPTQLKLEHSVASQRQYGIAVVHTDEGIDGVVSANGGSLHFHTMKQLAALWAQHRDSIEGQNPLDRGRIETVLKGRFRWPMRMLGVLDYALWDIAGKAFNQPIYRLLGATRDRIPAYASTVHCATDEQFVDVVEECKSLGFQAIKIHPYGIPDDDIRLCYTLREVAGDDVVLMLDPAAYPGPYDRRGALKVARVLDELRFHWLEDPLPVRDVVGLAELRRACQVVQVRMFDGVQDIHDYAELIRNRCIDIVAGPPYMPIGELMKLAGLAEVNNLNMEPHDFAGGTASLHVLLAITNGDYFEAAVPHGVFDEMMYPGVYLDPVRPDSKGYVHAPTKPGLGYEIDFDEAKKVTVETIKA